MHKFKDHFAYHMCLIIFAKDLCNYNNEQKISLTDTHKKKE